MTKHSGRLAQTGLVGLLLACGWLLMGSAVWSADKAKKEHKKDENSELAAEHAAVRKSLGKAKATLADAIKAALAKMPGSKAVEGFFEVLDGKAICYQVEVSGGGKHKAMLIDCELGHVMGVVAVKDDGHEDKAMREMKDAIAKSKITLTAAIELALKKHSGAKAFDVHPDLEKGKTVIDVELLDGKKILEVLIDPTSGAIVAEIEDKN